MNVHDKQLNCISYRGMTDTRESLVNTAVIAFHPISTIFFICVLGKHVFSRYLHRSLITCTDEEEMHSSSHFTLLFVICADMMITTTTLHPACHPQAAGVAEVVVAVILTHPITMAMKTTTTTTMVMITMTTVVAMMIPTMAMKKCIH